MKHKQSLATTLFALSLTAASVVNAENLNFNLVAATSGDNLFGQQSIVFSDGTFNLTVTGTVAGQAALIAKQVTTGLGVSLAAVTQDSGVADDPNTPADESVAVVTPADWGIKNGDGFSFALSNAAGQDIPFSNIRFNSAASAQWTTLERATVAVNGNSFNAKGHAYSADGSNVLVDFNNKLNCDDTNTAGVNECETNSWRDEVASTASLTATVAYNAADGSTSNLTDFRIANILVDAVSDADGDGVLVASDNCPAVSNVGQADTDTDGIGDACDDDVNGDGVYDLSFNFSPASPAENLYGQDSIAFSSLGGNFTLTVTASVGGSPAKLASQILNTGDNPLVGLGVSLSAVNDVDDPATTEIDESQNVLVPANWDIENNDAFTATLTNASGQSIVFSDPVVIPAVSKQITTLERGTLSFGGSDYLFKGNEYCNPANASCGTAELGVDYNNRLYCTNDSNAANFATNNCASDFTWYGASGSSITLLATAAYNDPNGSSSNVTQYRISDMTMSVANDADADTVATALDNCPNTPNTDQADADSDGIGDVCDDDPDGDGIANLVFDLTPDDKNGDGSINNSDSVFGQDQFVISNTTGSYTLTITATDDTGAAGKLSLQASTAGAIYGLGVKPVSGSTDRKINEGETVTFSVSDANGPVDVSNFSFVTADAFPMYGNERATIAINGVNYLAKGGAPGSTIAGSGNTLDGSSSWAAVENSTVSLTPTPGELNDGTPPNGDSHFRIVTVSFDLNSNDTTSDTDADGVADYVDNCPAIANGANEDNQANQDGDALGDACDDDRDGDGVLNASDAFPDDAAESADTDTDTVGDNADNCPNDANTNQLDSDGDLLGDACDADRDGDGILNTVEIAVGTNPDDNTDGDAAELLVLQTLNGDGSGGAVSVPAMGGFGLIALALSMLGFGVYGRRK